MNESDVKSFVAALNEDLRKQRPAWESRVEVPPDPTRAQLWADGYVLSVTLTRGHIDPGGVGQGSRKYDQLRMEVLRNERDPSKLGEQNGPILLETVHWKSVPRNGEPDWQADGGDVLASSDVFKIIRQRFFLIVDERK